MRRRWLTLPVVVALLAGYAACDPELDDPECVSDGECARIKPGTICSVEHWCVVPTPVDVVDMRVVDMRPPVVDMSPPVVDMAPPEVDMAPPEVDMAPPEVDMAPPEVDMAPPELDMAPPGIDMAPIPG
ncbi:MAG: hypothetical protein KC620_14255 [Myxococcales bacterium]|nr:hypothetical protein [Myxococcales bacterium]